MDKNLSLLEKNIGITFKRKELLEKSLIHKSYNADNNNEKLEFLGDRVLGLIISKNLLEIFPLDKEGSLDKKLASLVNRKICCEISKNFELEKYITIGNSRSKHNKIEDKILSDACEALIGAIYLDQGIIIVEKFILKFWKEYLFSNMKESIDAKTRLQEFCLKKFKVLPKYKLLSNTGPRHQPLFKVCVNVEKSKPVYGSGKSKKDAEQKAANIFLKKLGL